MKLSLKTVATLFGALGLAILGQPNCTAQCGLGGAIKPVAKLRLRPNLSSVRLLPAAFQEGHHSDDDGKWEATIIGFWHVTFTAKTINGASIPETVIDNALVVWHSDGTEIMNSGRPAQDGNFCMGIWKQTGPFTYKLNHFALGNQYAPGTPNGVVGDPAGPTRIVESVKVGSDGNHFSGPFTLTATDTSGNAPTVFTGVVTASRITLDTTVADIL
jgi:hypothetical protein